MPTLKVIEDVEDSKKYKEKALIYKLDDYHI